jgi:BirA family transcriptional regulator, biotin operon repressor / biotin---[acetyl-CoA-carboxylase] ligase
MQSGLSAEVFPGAGEMHFRTIDSTNSFAKRWLKNSRPPAGTIIRADEQTAGRGRRNRNWNAAPGDGFLATLICYPSAIDPAGHFLLNMAFSLAVHDIIESITGADERLRIKWPNDIYWENRKLAGILPESALMLNRFVWYIAGARIKVNQQAPEMDDPNAISLKRITGQHINTAIMGPALRKAFAGYYKAVLRGREGAIHAAYFNVLYGRNKQVRVVSQHEEAFTGTVDQLESDGRLWIRTEKGTLRKISFDNWSLRPHITH